MHTRHDDGKYHIGGHTYAELEGSRAQVYHGTAFRTSGGLTKKDIRMNKFGRLVSKAKSMKAKKEKRELTESELHAKYVASTSSGDEEDDVDMNGHLFESNRHDHY